MGKKTRWSPFDGYVRAHIEHSKSSTDEKERLDAYARGFEQGKFEAEQRTKALSDRELTETAEMIYNFPMDIGGIKKVLWQMCKKQIRNHR